MPIRIRRDEGAKLFFLEEVPDIIAEEALRSPLKVLR